MWPRMYEANRLIATWAKTQSRVAFVDVAAAMLDAHGKPRVALFRDDGLHMTPAGYAIWVRALEPVLASYGFATH
jgi:lysophospholipase L1-like esterase